MLKGLGGVIKWETIDNIGPSKAIEKAVDTWKHNGGDSIEKICVYLYQKGDQVHQYRWSPEDTYSERHNLITGSI